MRGRCKHAERTKGEFMNRWKYDGMRGHVKEDNNGERSGETTQSSVSYAFREQKCR